MVQSIISLPSTWPSRLARMTSTAPNCSVAMCGTFRSAVGRCAPALGVEVLRPESIGKQVVDAHDPAGGLDLQGCTTVLEEQLAAAAARGDQLQCPVFKLAEAHEVLQGATAGGEQLADHGAFGAQGDPVGGVFDIAA